MRYDSTRSRPDGGFRSRLADMGPILLALAIALVVFLGLARKAPAQELGESVKRLGEENARLFLHPVVAGLGANLNSGFFHTAGVHEPLGFDVSVRAMGALAPGDAERFVPVLPAEVTYDGRTFADPYAPAGEATTSPTAVGAGPGMGIAPAGEFREALVAAGEDPEAYAVHLPEGLDLPAVPAGLAQVAVGLPLGTEVAYRFIPTVDLGRTIGRIRMRGFGVRHSVSQWFPVPSPIDVSVSVGSQRLEVGDYLELTARQASLVAGRDLGLLIVYAAGGVESARAKVDYLVENTSDNPALPPEGTRLTFRDEGENRGRGTVGLTFDFPVLKLNAEYSHARYRVASAKLLIGVR